jgi:hypothetical protein
LVPTPSKKLTMREKRSRPLVCAATIAAMEAAPAGPKSGRAETMLVK